MTDSLINAIKQYCDKHTLLSNSGDTVVIGLSGGPDSVFLLTALTQICKGNNISLIAAHLDHEWRPESSKELAFCHAMAAAFEVPFVGMRASQLPVQPRANGSQEATGRALRRQFFAMVQQQYQASAIALAHHEQDQQETFFIRLIRGSSLTGLTSMSPKDGLYIRPLLETSKTEILSYLDHNKISYISDPSNSSPLYLRNRIRHTVIPALRAADDRFNNSFKKTLQQLQKTELFLENLTAETFTDLRETCTRPTQINLKKFYSLHSTMQKRILVHWLCTEQVPFVPSEGLLQEIISFLTQPQDTSHALHTSWHIKKKSGKASIIMTSITQK